MHVNLDQIGADQIGNVIDALDTVVAKKADLVEFADLIEQELPRLVRENTPIAKRAAAKTMRFEIVRVDTFIPGVGTWPLAVEIVATMEDE